MNILPLIMALVMMLSVLTIEKLEKFKNQSIVQREYQAFLRDNERVFFNDRERKLFGKNEHRSHSQLTFRYLYDKSIRDRDVNEAKQYRMLLSELIKIVYGETAFFKEMENKRPHFIEEMFTAIEKASEAAPEKLIRRTEDLARLKLDDPELQNAFYLMLKGTIQREKLIELKEEAKELPPRQKEKGYVSLFTFIHNEGVKKIPTIEIAHSSREILKAIFVNDEVVEAIIAKRKELSGKDKESGADEAFKIEFMGKRRHGIDEKLLDFSLPKSKKISSDYD